MRKTTLAFILFVIFFFSGCSKKESSSPVSPGVGGDTGIVSFAIQTQQGQNGGIEFDAKPSADVTITVVNIIETTTSFADTLEDDGTTVYQKDQWVAVAEYTGVTSGMHFKFNFIGKTSPDTKNFNVTSDYTVP